VPAVVATGQSAFGLPATAVGDSVMLAARKALATTFPSFMKVDAHISRQPSEIFDRIRARKATGQLGDVVVIHAGTNGPIKTSELIVLVGQLSDRSRVILVTCHGDRSWIPQSNAAIAVTARHFAGTNVRVADWNAASAQHRDWFYADGIHTKSAGSQAYADVIKAAMAR
jgi:hypothetical protein